MTVHTAHLCAGYDGLGLALDIVHPGHVPRWFAEVDPDVSQVLKREHPGVPNVGDIKTVPWELSPHVDLLTSGDPCQSISVAGRQAGRSDPRFLWPWVRQAIAALRPYRVFLENVQNMVSHDGGRTLRERLDDLRALGYASRWTVLGACAVGAPHHRHRWFLVADLVERGPTPEAVRVDPKAVCGARGRALLPTPVARDASTRGEGTQAYWDARDKAPPLGAVASLLPVGSWGRFAEAVAWWESLTDAPAPVASEPNSNGGRRLSPLLPEWMMGLPPGYLTADLGRSAAIKAAGNGVVPLQAAAAYRRLT